MSGPARCLIPNLSRYHTGGRTGGQVAARKPRRAQSSPDALPSCARTHDPIQESTCRGDMPRSQSHVRVRVVCATPVTASLQGSTSHMSTAKPPWWDLWTALYLWPAKQEAKRARSDRLYLKDSEKMMLSSDANTVSLNIYIFKADADRLVCGRARELHDPLDKRVVRARHIKLRSVAHRFHTAAVPQSFISTATLGQRHTARSFAASSTAWPSSQQ